MFSASKPWLEQVKGDTYCIVTAYSRIPLYRLDGGRVILIDSGLAVPDRAGILHLLEENNFTVTDILTSHAHIDHTGNHRALKERYGAWLWMTPFDAGVSASPMGMKGYLYNASYRGVMGYARSMYCRADRIILPEENRLTVEGATFEVLRLPGHAPSHTGFVTPDGVAYLADALMSDEVLDSVRIPYCTCCELDLQTKEWVQRLSYPKYIIPHNGVYEDIGALAQRNIRNLQEKIELVAGVIDGPLSLETIVARAMAAMGVQGDIIYKIDVSEQNVRVFVQHLLDMGRVTTYAKEGVILYAPNDKT